MSRSERITQTLQALRNQVFRAPTEKSDHSGQYAARALQIAVELTRGVDRCQLERRPLSTDETIGAARQLTGLVAELRREETRQREREDIRRLEAERQKEQTAAVWEAFGRLWQVLGDKLSPEMSAQVAAVYETILRHQRMAREYPAESLDGFPELAATATEMADAISAEYRVKEVPAGDVLAILRDYVNHDEGLTDTDETDWDQAFDDLDRTPNGKDVSDLDDDIPVHVTEEWDTGPREAKQPPLNANSPAITELDQRISFLLGDINDPGDLK